jgi:Flp pilus assembly protein TadG
MTSRTSTRPCPRSWRRDERGSVAIEAAIGVPTFGLFVAMIILGGRVEIASQSVDAAAYEAARAASIERTQSEAISSGRSAATSSLHDQGLQCAATDITVDAAGFNAPLGTTAQVTATVTCKVNLGDLSIPGLPGTRSITATASSPIDAYRERR